MPQNSYSIYLMMGNLNKSGLGKIYIRIKLDGKEYRIPTKVRVTGGQFNGAEIIRHPKKEDLNEILRQEKDKAETAILKSEARGVPLNFKVDLSGSLSSFVQKHLSGIANKETRRNRDSTYKKLDDIPISKVGRDYLKNHEQKLLSEGLDINTVHYQMKRIKILLNAAIKEGVIDRLKNINEIKDYSPPKAVNKIPEYLTLEEMESFNNITRNVVHKTKKTSGYYFLLSCYTGYRLSDLKAFKFEDQVRSGMITLRASKNDKIVSIPVYKKLKEVLDYCKSNPLDISEQNFRIYVKEIASDAGINTARRNIKVHTARHTFAMMLIDKGFSIDEVAEMLGDSRDVAKVYARINNKHLANKVRERLS